MRRLRDPLLEIEGLCVDYGFGDDAVHAVAGATWCCIRGEVLGLAGESGSGKSTLAYAAIRLLRPPGVITGGEVRYHPASRRQTLDLLAAGEEQLRELRWSQIAVVLQSAMNALNPVLHDRRAARRRAPGPPPGHEPERRARPGRPSCSTMVGIPADRLASYPHELSGGMRQRVMIAMALALDPRIIIMDEPTTALDVVTQREILEELMALRTRLGFAVLFITHDLSLLVEVADSIAVMYAGRLVERAQARGAVPRPAPPVQPGPAQLVPADARRSTGHDRASPARRRTCGRSRRLRFHPRCGYAMDRCRTECPAAAAGRRDGRQAACWLQDGARPGADLPEPAVARARLPRPVIDASRRAASYDQPAPRRHGRRRTEPPAARRP